MKRNITSQVNEWGFASAGRVNVRDIWKCWADRGNAARLLCLFLRLSRSGGGELRCGKECFLVGEKLFVEWINLLREFELSCRDEKVEEGVDGKLLK